MNKIALRSPAKLNLFLKVLAKRPDGYHRIETVFERIDLCDRIVLKKSTRGIRLISDREDLPAGEANLAYKAAHLLLEKMGTSSGVTIEIKKNIPISAGLGGGSSNAASVLLGLNKLYNFALGLQDLLGLARRLGADVAFFIHESPFAIGESRGDIIIPIRSKFRLWQVLVVPPFGLSTKDVYESLDFYPVRRPELRDQRRDETKPSNGVYQKDQAGNLDAVVEALKSKDLTGLNNLLYNSLEKVALARYRELGQVKDSFLNIGVKGTLVSGSGPTVFGLTRTRKEAMNTGKKLKKGVLANKKNWLVYVVHTL